MNKLRQRIKNLFLPILIIFVIMIDIFSLFAGKIKNPFKKRFNRVTMSAKEAKKHGKSTL